MHQSRQASMQGPGKASLLSITLCFVLIAASAHASGPAVELRGSRQNLPAPVGVGGEPEAGAIDPRRVIALQGQTNFRDLGGYETLDGRHVRWGAIYRSGELSELTAADYRRLSALHIRTVYDLRDAGERARQPTVWAAGSVSRFDSPKPTTQTVANIPSDPQAARAQMQAFYAKAPDRYAVEYGVIFRELLAAHQPLLLHCTGGKDRTGVASALILTALGVPRADVTADYQLTDRLLRPAQLPAKTSLMKTMQTMSPDVQAEFVRADPAYLAAAFDAIDHEYGSVDGYLHQKLGVGPAERAKLKALYLE